MSHKWHYTLEPVFNDQFNIASDFDAPPRAGQILVRIVNGYVTGKYEQLFVPRFDVDDGVYLIALDRRLAYLHDKKGILSSDIGLWDKMIATRNHCEDINCRSPFSECRVYMFEPVVSPPDELAMGAGRIYRCHLCLRNHTDIGIEMATGMLHLIYSHRTRLVARRKVRDLLLCTHHLCGESPFYKDIFPRDILNLVFHHALLLEKCHCFNCGVGLGKKCIRQPEKSN